MQESQPDNNISLRPTQPRTVQQHQGHNQVCLPPPLPPPFQNDLLQIPTQQFSQVMPQQRPQFEPSQYNMPRKLFPPNFNLPPPHIDFTKPPPLQNYPLEHQSSQPQTYTTKSFLAHKPEQNIPSTDVVNLQPYVKRSEQPITTNSNVNNLNKPKIDAANWIDQWLKQKKIYLRKEETSDTQNMSVS